MIPGKTIPMADNPPGYDQNLGPGPARDQAWKDYLSGKNADGTQRAIGAPMALPKPEAVSDKSLRAIGAAGRSQGVSYAWGGNTDANGPSKGHGDNGGGADEHEDWNRTGFDCGGLVRYSFQQGAGVDVFERPDGKELGSGTDRIDISKHLTKVPDAVQIPSAQISSKAQVGDILVFFNGGTEHTGVYVGNGFMLDAPYSGVPVRIDNANRDGRITDVLRLNP
ncbi:cell wall-associated hydrolase [Mycobacteroides abscessus]|nr:cell wall-associated hydrolase [Mycobacteroides abscessus]